jgi:hypothetical protein
MRFALFAFSVCLTCASFSAQAKMYKWVDEEGQMHFGDRIPEKYLVKEHDELNEHGVKMRHREAAKTDEERAEEKRLQKEKEAAALAEKKKQQRDRVLLDTYTTEADLIAARDSRLDAVDTQIRLAKSIIAESNKKIENLEKNVVDIKASNREVPADMYKRINSQRHQVEVHTGVMQNHIKRRDEIAVQFDGYIERFKVLKAEQKAKRERMEKERSSRY